MNAIFKMLLYLGLVIILVAIAYANGEQTVDVTYFPGRTVEDLPVFLVILASVFAGMLVAGIIAAFEHLKHGVREREARRKVEALEAELRELRTSFGVGAASVDAVPLSAPGTAAPPVDETEPNEG